LLKLWRLAVPVRINRPVACTDAPSFAGGAGAVWAEADDGRARMAINAAMAVPLVNEGRRLGRNLSDMGDSSPGPQANA
jgi:hypothetical protein